MRDEWGHFYWLGGSPCSGKSSIAEILAAQFGMRVYKCDDQFDAHLKQATPENQLYLHQIGQMKWDEIWMRPLAEQITNEIAIYREQISMILDDLRALPDDKPVVVEGTALLPDLVAPLLPQLEQAIYIVPTAHFQKSTYAQREWIHGILAHCREPEQAFANWMDRDVGFGRWVVATAVTLNLSVLIVDGQQSLTQNANLVAKQFGLSTH